MFKSVSKLSNTTSRQSIHVKQFIKFGHFKGQSIPTIPFKEFEQSVHTELSNSTMSRINSYQTSKLSNSIFYFSWSKTLYHNQWKTFQKQPRSYVLSHPGSMHGIVLVYCYYLCTRNYLTQCAIPFKNSNTKYSI